MEPRAIVLVAVQKGDPVERQAFLDEACGSNRELRAQVEALLQAELKAAATVPGLKIGATPVPIANLDEAVVRGSDVGAFGSFAGASSSSSAPAAPPELTFFLGPPERPGEIGRLGGYGVLRVLGKGGMGVVLLAEDLKL